MDITTVLALVMFVAMVALWAVLPSSNEPTIAHVVSGDDSVALAPTATAS